MQQQIPHSNLLIYFEHFLENIWADSVSANLHIDANMFWKYIEQIRHYGALSCLFIVPEKIRVDNIALDLELCVDIYTKTFNMVTRMDLSTVPNTC